MREKCTLGEGAKCLKREEKDLLLPSYETQLLCLTYEFSKAGCNIHSPPLASAFHSSYLKSWSLNCRACLTGDSFLVAEEKSLLFIFCCFLFFMAPRIPPILIPPKCLKMFLIVDIKISYTVSIFTCSFFFWFIFLFIMYNLNPALVSHIFQKMSAYAIYKCNIKIDLRGTCETCKALFSTI